MNRFSLLAAGALMGFGGSMALAQPINIGDFSGSEQVITFTPGFGGQSAPFTYEGVTFSENGGGTGGPGFNASINWGSYFANIPGSSQSNGFNDQWGDSLIIMQLPSGIRRFGCLLSTTPITTWTMNLYDSGNNLIGSDTRTMPGTSQAVFIGYQTSVDIARVEIDETNGENGNISLMDDVRLEGVGGGGYTCNITGACPGNINVNWAGAQPNKTQGIVFASNTGSFTISSGSCAGTQLGLGTRNLQLVRTIGTGSGSGSIGRAVGSGACGGFVQLVTVGSPCETSSVGQIP